MLREDSVWRCGKHEISLVRPRIMGILNVTPDSFSDGDGKLDQKAAVVKGLDMLDQGADIIDIGGESTRPGATPVDEQEEARRVIPVVRSLVATGAPISIDTRHPEVARMCVRLGCSIVNDVSGFTDPDMVAVAAETSCGCVVICGREAKGNSSRRSVVLDNAHTPMRPVASNRRFTLPEEAPIMREVMGFLGDQARALMRAGVAHDRICIDPGAGFDKDTDKDVVIQRNTKKLESMGYALMQAVSRKRYVGDIAGVDEPVERDAATIGQTIWAVESGARVLRVHNVGEVAQAVNSYWSVAKKDPRRGFVSLGSNVGDRLGNLTRAVKLINDLPLTCVVAASHAYETEPAYGIETAVANAVVEIRTELAPMILIERLLDVENALGRERDSTKPGFGPRTIDCDLCWVEGEEHYGARLRLPHPHLGERDYVLVPMEDLMHDPVRFLAHAGVPVLPVEERVGHVVAELGVLEWETL